MATTSSYIPDRTTVLNITQSLVKIASRSASLASYFDSSTELTEAKAVISGIQSVFSIRSGFNSIEKFFKSTQATDLEGPRKATNILTSVSATIGVATAIMSALKTLNSVEVICLAEISQALGGTSVIGQTLVSIFSFANVSSGFGICRSVIGIAIDSLRIHERREQIKHTQMKSRYWTAPITLNTIQEKIDTLAQKSLALANQLDLIENDLVNLIEQTKASMTAYQNSKVAYTNASGFSAIFLWSEMRKKKKETKHLLQEKEALTEQVLLKTEQQKEKLAETESLKRIQDIWDGLTDQQKEKLQRLGQDKKAKWDIKNLNLIIELIKAVSSLFLKVVGLIISIASLTLGLLGITIVPLFITITTISLVLVIASLSLDAFKKHSCSRPPPSIPVPIF